MHGSLHGTVMPSVVVWLIYTHIMCMVTRVFDAGAAVLKQLSFKAAMKHKAVVAEVACNAKSRNFQPILGVLFDEVSRCVKHCGHYQHAPSTHVCIIGNIGTSSQGS